MILGKPYNGARIAIIGFTDAERPWWLRFFPKGFRHCFALISDAGRWVVVNPMSHWTDIAVLPEAADNARVEDIVRALADKNIAARVCAVAEPARRTLPPTPFTCVEVVKRIVGLRAPWVLTPAALARFIEKNHIQ